jgi:hypothetical protein
MTLNRCERRRFWRRRSHARRATTLDGAEAESLCSVIARDAPPENDHAERRRKAEFRSRGRRRASDCELVPFRDPGDGRSSHAGPVQSLRGGCCRHRRRCGPLRAVLSRRGASPQRRCVTIRTRSKSRGRNAGAPPRSRRRRLGCRRSIARRAGMRSADVLVRIRGTSGGKARDRLIRLR